MGFILAAITYVGWGAGDIFGIFATRKIGAYRATALVYIFGFIIASCYIPFALPELSKITLPLFILNVILGFGACFGNFLLNEGFKRSSASLVGIIVQAFPAIVLLLSALIFKDALSMNQILWTGVIFFGVFLCMVNFADFKRSDIFTDSGVRLALLAALIFVVYFTFFRIFADVYGWFWPNYISIATFPLVLVAAKRIFKVSETLTLPNSKKVLLATIISAILLRGGDIALNYGIAAGLASTVAPIAGASPTLFILLASLIYKDPVSTQQKVGIGISLVGIVLLSFWGS